MTDLTGYDAAWPPGAPPRDDVVCGYIGGDTPHIWSKADWDSQPARYRLPIWTRSNPTGFSGVNEGYAAVAAARSIGCPGGVTIALDYEQAQDAGYLEGFNNALGSQGFYCIVYGAASFLFANPKSSEGYWGAQWDGNSFLPAGWSGKQYADPGSWDDDTFSSTLPLWDTQTGTSTNPAPPTAPVTPRTDVNDIMAASRADGSLELTVPSHPTPNAVFTYEDNGGLSTLTLRPVVWTGNKPTVLPNVELPGGDYTLHLENYPSASGITVSRVAGEAEYTLGFVVS